MYTAHFGLKDEPFSLTPDPSALYLSPGHAEALAAVEVGLRSHRGLIVMTGEVGTGKTTLLYSILSKLGSDVRTAYILNTSLSFEDILRQALADFGVPCPTADKVALLNALNGFLMTCASDGATAALVIDEAQNLAPDTLENLRLLSNYETFTTKLLQIVLVGQPELEAKLRTASLRQIAERIAVHCHVNPLTPAERWKYVEHRLQTVGGSTEVFKPAALRLLLRKSLGIPRRINILCHNALLFAYGRGLTRVPTSLARMAVREREGRGLVTASAPLLSEASPWWRLRPVVLAAGSVLLVTLAAMAAVRWQDGLLQYSPEAEVGAAGTLAGGSWVRRAPGQAHDPVLAFPTKLSVETAFAGGPALGHSVLSYATTLSVETSFGGPPTFGATILVLPMPRAKR
jgi:general secretion pathway protein A